MSKPKDTFIFFSKEERGPLNFTEIGFHDFTVRKHTNKFFWAQPTYTLHYVREGSGTLIYNKKSYQFREGDLFFLPPNEPIFYYPNKNDPCSYFWFGVMHDSARIFGFTMGFSKDVPIRSIKSPQTATYLLDSLFNANVPNSIRYYMALSVFMQILVMTLPSKNEDVFSSVDFDVVTTAKEIIEINYRNSDFTVNDIPDLLHISHSQLCRVFKAKTGMTPIKYLVDVRLNHASRLLNERSYSALELVDMVGFNSERNFTKHFKSKYGMSVTEYRKEMLKAKHTHEQILLSGNGLYQNELSKKTEVKDDEN